jgi:hypothetical protein
MTAKRFSDYNGDLKTLYNTSWANGMMMKQFPYAAYIYALQIQ